MSGDLHAGEGMSGIEGGALPGCVADPDEDGLAPISEIHAEDITHTKKRRVVGIRRLFVLANNVVKAVLPGRCKMPKLEFKDQGWGVDPRGKVGKDGL